MKRFSLSFCYQFCRAERLNLIMFSNIIPKVID